MAIDATVKARWNYEAYARIPDDGQRHEIVDGEHYVNPAPNLYHQQISRRVQFQLYSAIELKDLGLVINAPVDVQLTDHDIVQPDLVIVRNANRHILTPANVRGIPDLLIEIVSPSNPGHDLVTKRQAYQRAGVPEYWIVFPDEHRVLRLMLTQGAFQESWFEDQIPFDIPPLMHIDLRQVW